jgi:Uma2 family endonuclease
MAGAIVVEDTKIPPLCAGDRLSAEEFERRYDAMPNLKKAELINGVVYMGSPVSQQEHGGPHFDLIGWLSLYRMSTPGVTGGDNSTIRLPLRNRPQPDACLYVDASQGGQARIDSGYLKGPPELVAEVAATSANYDLHDKKDLYQTSGVREYLIWRVLDKEIDWFVLREGVYKPMAFSSSGFLQSEIFPGLWLDPAALLRGDWPAVLRAAQQGLASGEHTDFVARLQKSAHST